MWPIVVGAMLIGGALLARRRSQTAQPGPLTEEPNEAATEAEAVATAESAAAEAAEAAKAGDTEAAAEAADKAAEASAAAAGTSVSDVVDQFAKKAQELLAAAAAKSGQPVPATSPGQPPLPKEKSEPTVLVDGEDVDTDEAGAPPVKPTKVSLPKTVEEVVKALPIPVPISAKPPPLATEETKPVSDPNGTVALARLLLERELSPGWRDAEQPPVKRWQQKVGLTADGKFGPKSALKMGSEVGVLPLVRFWSRGSSKASALKKYRNDLHTLSANLVQQKKAEHAAAIEASAEREDGRSHANPGAAPVTKGERLAALENLGRKVVSA